MEHNHEFSYENQKVPRAQQLIKSTQNLAYEFAPLSAFQVAGNK